jgi:hypothetical protein
MEVTVMRLIDADAMEQRFCYGVNAEPLDWVYDTHDLPEILMEMPTIDAVPVVRCAECAVPHNRWTGCPKLGGLIPPDDFYCGFGRKDGDRK